jgi:hypothetical protein
VVGWRAPGQQAGGFINTRRARDLCVCVGGGCTSSCIISSIISCIIPCIIPCIISCIISLKGCGAFRLLVLMPCPTSPRRLHPCCGHVVLGCEGGRVVGWSPQQAGGPT